MYYTGEHKLENVADASMVIEILKCANCGEEMTSSGGGSSTYVGYISPPGHDHDDNCVVRRYRCANGHEVKISKQNRCSAKGCEWIGASECFCHPDKKVKEWPGEIEE